MSFKRNAGKTKKVFLPVKPSTALNEGELLTFSSGKLVAASSTTNAVDIVGVLGKTITSSDSDYADDRLVPVEVPVERHTLWEGDVTSGLVSTDVGLEVDLTDSETINRGASTKDIAKVVQRISATKGIFFIKFNGAY